MYSVDPSTAPIREADGFRGSMMVMLPFFPAARAGLCGWRPLQSWVVTAGSEYGWEIAIQRQHPRGPRNMHQLVWRFGKLDHVVKQL